MQWDREYDIRFRVNLQPERIRVEWWADLRIGLRLVFGQLMRMTIF